MACFENILVIHTYDDIHMGQVTMVGLPCYVVLLSFDSKNKQQDRHTFVTWSIYWWFTVCNKYIIRYPRWKNTSHNNICEEIGNVNTHENHSLWNAQWKVFQVTWWCVFRCLSAWWRLLTVNSDKYWQDSQSWSILGTVVRNRPKLSDFVIFKSDFISLKVAQKEQFPIAGKQMGSAVRRRSPGHRMRPINGSEVPQLHIE